MLGLVVLVLGVLAFEVKRPQWQGDEGFIGDPLEMQVWSKLCAMASCNGM